MIIFEDIRQRKTRIGSPEVTANRTLKPDCPLSDRHCSLPSKYSLYQVFNYTFFLPDFRWRNFESLWGLTEIHYPTTIGLSNR